MKKKSSKPSAVLLDRIYRAFNRPRYIAPDPLELVLRFPDPRDRELAALAASSLAYGRVNRILFSVSAILDAMGGKPFDFITSNSPEDMRHAFRGFKHRFHSGDDMANLFAGAKRALAEYGSLEQCFASGFHPGDSTVCNAEEHFSVCLCSEFDSGKSTLLPSPADGSACKRLNLMLRWLVRKDEVDPGGWDSIPASALIVPVDTHMHRLARSLGFTKRKAADLATALEITKAFARLSPEDPVKYDFSLTRFGINPEFPKTPESADAGF